jgi:hypothetical protein
MQGTWFDMQAPLPLILPELVIRRSYLWMKLSFSHATRQLLPRGFDFSFCSQNQMDQVDCGTVAEPLQPQD